MYLWIYKKIKGERARGGRGDAPERAPPPEKKDIRRGAKGEEGRDGFKEREIMEMRPRGPERRREWGRKGGREERGRETGEGRGTGETGRDTH